MRDGFVASLALVPPVFVYATVFGGSFPAVFLALVAAPLRRRTDWLVALASATTLAIGVALVLPGTWHVLVAGGVVSGAAALVFVLAARRLNVLLTVAVATVALLRALG
jgi:uncharacterized membrane protein YjjP (DUF1212 family)